MTATTAPPKHPCSLTLIVNGETPQDVAEALRLLMYDLQQGTYSDLDSQEGLNFNLKYRFEEKV